jgi:hypothetical protein
MQEQFFEGVEIRRMAKKLLTLPEQVEQPAWGARRPALHPSPEYRMRRNRKSLILLLSATMAVGLCAFQYGDQNGLNSMPFAQVQPLVSDLARARSLAKQGNIDLLAGQKVPGKNVRLRGEVTDANCYLGNDTHDYDHAFCAKLCAAAGSPLVFVSDQGGQVYLVISERNSVRLPEDVLNNIGVPGIVVNGKLLETDGVRTLAIEGLAP